jgi:hypothetical protein
MRFMALREGVHRIEKLRVTGVGDDVDFVVRSVRRFPGIWAGQELTSLAPSWTSLWDLGAIELC